MTHTEEQHSPDRPPHPRPLKDAIPDDTTITSSPSLLGRLLRIAWRCGPNWIRHNTLPYRAPYDIRRHGPLYCGLYVTLRCNLSCPWCVNPPLADGVRVTDFDADAADVERILDHPLFRTVAHINLTGGEPLLNENIDAIVNLIRRRGFLVGMVTNGMLLPSRMPDLIKSGISDVRVSMYAHTLDRLADILPSLRGRLSLATSYIILGTELARSPETIEKAIQISRDAGAVGTRLNFYMPTGRLDDDNLVYDDNPALATLKARLARTFPDYPIYWRPAVRRHVRGPREKSCRQLWETFHVDARGNLGLCCRYCTPSPAHGNLFSQETADIFNSDRLHSLRAALLAPGHNVPAACANCLYLNSGNAARKVLASPLPSLLRLRGRAARPTPSESPE